jgi:SAM-dependent methyltransferase
MDEAKLEQFMGAVVGHMTGAAVCFQIWLGERTGLWRAMAGAGPLTAAQLAARAGTQPRLTEEWLKSNAASGLVAHDVPAGTFSLSEEAAMALAIDTSPVFVARGMDVIGSLYADIDKIAGAVSGDGKLAWGEHHPHLFSGTEWFFRTGYQAFLTTTWIPAMDGVADLLSAGGTVADIGCGHGASAVVIAQGFPAARVHGFDFHEPSVQVAGKRAAEAGVADRTTFSVATAKSYAGSYDLICFFDCLHDMGDPVGIAAYAREHLTDDGSVLLVEPFALDGPANITDNPMAPILYMASASVCSPNSLSQEVGAAIGAQAGPGKLREVLAEAGFSQFEVVASSPMNLVIQARV